MPAFASNRTCGLGRHRRRFGQLRKPVDHRRPLVSYGGRFDHAGCGDRSVSGVVMPTRRACRCCSPSCACPPLPGSGRPSPRPPTARAGRRHARCRLARDTRSPNAAQRRTARHLARGAAPAGQDPRQLVDFTAASSLGKARVIGVAEGRTQRLEGTDTWSLGRRAWANRISPQHSARRSLIDAGYARAVPANFTDLVQQLQAARQERRLKLTCGSRGWCRRSR